MLVRLLAEAPEEMLFTVLVPLTTRDLVKLSLSCRPLLRLLFADEEDESMVLLNAVARGVGFAASRSSQLPRVRLSEPLGEAPLQNLGLSLRICSRFCAVLHCVKLPEAISLESPAELLALTTAHAQLSELAKVLGRKVMKLGPPVGALLPTGQVEWFIIDFPFPVRSQDEMQTCSEWKWLDVPPKVRLTGANPQAQTAFRVGVQLQGDVSSGRCERPELRCAVAAPLQAWVVLHAVSAVVGTTFEVGLAAGDFDSYGREDNGWYFPREECSWRDSPDEDAESCASDGSIRHQDGHASEIAHDPISVRVLLKVCSAGKTRIGGWKQGRSIATGVF